MVNGVNEQFKWLFFYRYNIHLEKTCSHKKATCYSIVEQPKKNQVHTMN